MDEDKKRQIFENWFEPSGRGLDRDADGDYKFMTAYKSWSDFSAGWDAAMEHLATGKN